MARSPQGRNRPEPVSGNPPGPTKIKNPPLGGIFCFGGLGLGENRSVRQTRPQERLVHRSNAEVPAGFNRQRQWAPEGQSHQKFAVIRIPTRRFYHSGTREASVVNQSERRMQMRVQNALKKYRSWRRRPEGVRAREAIARETIRPVLPNMKRSFLSREVTTFWSIQSLIPKAANHSCEGHWCLP